MGISDAEKEVILQIYQFLGTLIAEKGWEEETSNVNIVGRENLGRIWAFFESRCEIYLENNGNYYIPAKQYLPFIFNGRLHKGNEYPLIKGNYSSLAQVVSFHLGLERLGFEVNPEWTHNLDGSLLLRNTLNKKADTHLCVSSVDYLKSLADTLVKPSIWTSKYRNPMKNLWFYLTSLDGKRFVVENEKGRRLSFSNVEKLIDFQNLLINPGIMDDFKSIESFNPDSRFTVWSGTYRSFASYKDFLEKVETIAFVRNHTVEGSFEMTHGRMQGKFKSGLAYKNALEIAKSKNIASIKNHTITGAFEVISGGVRGLFQNWEAYRTFSKLNLGDLAINQNEDGSFQVVVEEQEKFEEEESSIETKEVEEDEMSSTETIEVEEDEIISLTVNSQSENQINMNTLSLFLENVLKTRTLGHFQTLEQFILFRSACLEAQIPVVTHKNPNEFTTIQGTFKSIDQYTALERCLHEASISIDNVFGHQTCGIFQMFCKLESQKEDYEWIAHTGSSGDEDDIWFTNVNTGKTVQIMPENGKIKSLWRIVRSKQGFIYWKGVHNNTFRFDTPSEFVDSKYLVRFDSWNSSMFWINKKTNETYNETPPSWKWSKVCVDQEMNWNRASDKEYWAILHSKLRKLNGAEVLALYLLDTQLGHMFGLDSWVIVNEIARFLVERYILV